MRNIIRTFIKYPILGNVIVVTLLMFGWINLQNMKTTFFPPIPSKTIYITASYPGASPEEIEEAIVLKIEDNLKGVTGVERVTSVSRENSCTISVEVLTGFDINIVLQDVKNAVDQISTFPTGMEQITTYKQEMRNFAIDFVISGDVDLTVLKKYSRYAERDLLATEGISKVTLRGFPNEEIEVSFRESDLQAYGLTFSEVASAISNSNIKITGGTIKGSEEEILIRADNKEYYAEDLANHVIKATDDGVIIRLKDVADLKDCWADTPDRVYFNGKPAVRVIIQNTNEEDLFDVAQKTREYVDKFNKTYKGVTAKIVRDGSEVIMERVNILAKNGLMGLMLVLLFLSLSLNPRMSFWVAIGIPISFAGMLMVGPMYGLTINVMSLMAMILVLGIIVDDGIVIAENIFQHHERGEKPIPAAVNGTIEVLPSVISSVLTTVVIFATFFFLEGGLGDRSRDTGFVVIATLLISLVEAAFVLPAHIAHSKTLCDASKKKSWFERNATRVLMGFRNHVYAPVLRYSVRHPYVIVSIVVSLFIITIGALKGSIIKTTFFPIIEGRSVTISMEMPAGTPARITDSIMVKIEDSVWKVNDEYNREYPDKPDLILSTTRILGSGTHQGELYVTLITGEKREWSSLEATNRFRDQIGIIEGTEKLEVGGNSHWGKPISIAMSSNNLGELREAKEVLKAELRQVDKLKDVVDDDPPGLREVTIHLEEKAYALGLTTGQVMSQVRYGFFGNEAQRILRGIDEIKIRVRYTKSDRSSLEKLGDMRIRLSNGREFPLKEIADFSIDHGVMSVNHIDAQRVVKVEADITSAKESVPDIIADIKAEIMPDIIARYPDIRFNFEGQSRETQKTMNAIAKVLPPILIVMFMIIVVTFRSFSQALIVFLLIPFSIVGVLWGHYVQGYIASMQSLFGAIALIGIIVNDALVLVSAMNQRLKEGMKFTEAVIDSGISRFRPVFLTSITTIAGLGPLIMEKSHQAQFLSPMAISVAYGLLFGTLLNLIMLPSMLTIVNHMKVFFGGLFKSEKPTPESVEPAVREEYFVHEQSNETC